MLTRVLVVHVCAQWKIMLDVLEWVMEVLGLSYHRLDGSTPVRAYARQLSKKSVHVSLLA